MSRRLKICIVTGSRAEYGLFVPLLHKIREEESMQLQLLVTGMHLSPDFGLTYQEIEADGFIIDEKVEILLSGDSPVSVTKSAGIGMIGYADAFNRLSPDWVVVLGDRFETFAAAAAAHIAKIPIAHLHGGELTSGANDDAFRHSITKMSLLHFSSAEVYRGRVIQLGEQPDKVFNVGAIGLDNIRELKLLSRDALSEKLEFAIDEHTLLVTFHPVTLENKPVENQIQDLLDALNQFPKLRLIFTLPNADAGGKTIIRHIQQFVDKNKQRAKAFTNLGQLNYLSALKHIVAIVGNSSSGIIEAPYFKIPTVNIGKRQDGRLRGKSIIDTCDDTKSIIAGINQALELSVKKNSSIANPYGNGHTAEKIVHIMKKVGRIHNVQKEFYDIKL